MTRIAIFAGVLLALVVASSSWAYSDIEAGEDTGVEYVMNDAVTPWTADQYATHEASFPHWKWIWSNSQDKYVKRELTNTPWPKRACTPANEHEMIDVWDEYYKAFVTYRCICYSDEVCGWERVDRYGGGGVWAPTALWGAAWVYVGSGLVRDVHRLCPSVVCTTYVWADHTYKRKRG